MACIYCLTHVRLKAKFEFSPFSPFFNVYRESLIVYIRSLIFLIIRSKIHNISVTRELTAFISHDLPYLFLMFGHAKGTLERTKFRKQAWRLHDLKKKYIESPSNRKIQLKIQRVPETKVLVFESSSLA